MSLKSLFNKLVPPKKVATATPMSVERRPANKFFVQLANLEAAPIYPIKQTLTIGSEVGDVVVKDQSLSPKHATFTVKNGLVSVTDNGSAEGTMLNGAQLPRGRAVILEADDELNLGNLIIRIIGELDETIVEEPEETPPEVAIISRSKVGESEEQSEETIEKPAQVIKPRIQASLQKKGFFARLKARFVPGAAAAVSTKTSKSSKNKGVVRKGSGGGTHRSANTIPRVFGILLDVVWTLIIWQILFPFEEFHFFLEIIPDMLHEHVWPLMPGFAADMGIANEFENGTKTFLDLIADVENEAHLSYLVSLWINLRLASTVILGVSLGSYMAGIRSQDNFIWKRIGGLLREILGLITLPLFIFDLPALISRKTLKEVLSFTNLFVPSKGSVLISLLLFVPISLVVLLFSPFFAGLDLPEEVNFAERGAVKKSRAKGQATEVSAQGPEVVLSSQWFGASFKINSAQWWVLPRFNLKQEKTGRVLQPTLTFYNQAGTNMPLALDKTFDWAKLLTPIFSHNIMAHETYPTIWKYVESGLFNKSSALTSNLSADEKAKFSIELQSLLGVMFRLTPVTLWDHVQLYGPFVKGYLDTKNTLLTLIGNAPSSTWTIMPIGKTPFLIYDTPGAKPVEIYIPLVFGKGRAYRVNYSSVSEKAKLGKVLTADLWPKAEWQNPEVTQTYDLVKLIDTIAILTGPTPMEAEPQFETAYGAYFEGAAAMLRLTATDQRRLTYERTIENTINVLQQIESHYKKGKAEYPAEGLAKLVQRLQDLKAQFESGNAAFFGIETQPVVPVKEKKKK